MKLLPALLGLIILYGPTGRAGADIYSWTDTDGVRHFSNHSPPKGAEVLIVTEEVPYKAPSAEELLEAQKQEILADAQEKFAEMEAESLEKLEAVERDIEAARQEADQAIQEAAEWVKAAEEKSYSGRTSSIYSVYLPIRQQFPLYRKERIYSHFRTRPFLYTKRFEPEKRFEGRKGVSIRKNIDRRGPGLLNRLSQSRVHRPGGFSTAKYPGGLLRVR